MPTSQEGALAGVVVLELGGERTHYCGRLLAGLGADVILVEPPGGDARRLLPPLVGAEPGVGAAFAYANGGKRSIILDPAEADDRSALAALIAAADIVLSGELATALRRWGLSWDDLHARNPALVSVSITPVGETGPLADVEAPDLVCLAMGGLLWLGGYRDGPPGAPPFEQALFAGGSFAAVAALIALLHAERTGVGQHADVSIQQCVTLALENSIQFWDLERTLRRRTGGGQRIAGTGLFPALDGPVFVLAAGIGGNPFWDNLLRWLEESGHPGVERLSGPEWSDGVFLASDKAKAAFAEVFGSFAAARTRNALYEESQAYRVPCAPVNRPSDLLDSPQLQHRGSLVDLDLGNGEKVLSPGAPFRMSATPWQFAQRVPAAGEHSAEILATLVNASAAHLVRGGSQ